MTVREHLKSRPLLFDGAMGTYYAARNGGARDCERANLTNPAEIAAIHRAYREAGCEAIKTNTFAANAASLGADWEAAVRAGYRIAMESARGAFVFADIGPAEGENPAAEYIRLAELFLSLGAEHFLFETQSRADGLFEAAAHIKKRNPRAFVAVSFAAQPDGFTRAGENAAELLRRAAASGHVDAAGLNCVCGAGHMARLIARAADADVPLLAMPNAAYPTVRGNRVYYDGDPAYFARQLIELRARGARLLGGCCGTTPAYIAAAAKALASPVVPAIPASPVSSTKQVAPVAPASPDEPPRAGLACAGDAAGSESVRTGTRFLDALADPTRRPVAVELDPPQNADVTRFMRGARALMDAGADLITLADCPVARARMDASLLACKLRRELGAEVMPHMTCRDRNLNATQALLLALCAEGVLSVLIVTGDPVPSAGRDEVKSVYNFNSRRLIRYVRELGETLLTRPFDVFAALNVNAKNFDVQLALAKEKEESGACGFFTQPVLSERALDNLRRARQALRGRIAGGILPVVSERNARFLNAEVPGIQLDERVVALYEGADRARGEEIAVAVSRAAAAAMAPHVDGFYLMTPFGRTGLIARVTDALSEDGLLLTRGRA